jgi:hypothetical protein
MNGMSWTAEKENARRRIVQAISEIGFDAESTPTLEARNLTFTTEAFLDAMDAYRAAALKASQS